MADKITTFPLLSAMDTDDRIPLVDEDQSVTRAVGIASLLAGWQAEVDKSIDEKIIAPGAYSPDVMSILGNFFAVTRRSGIGAFDELRLPDATTTYLEVRNNSSYVWDYSIANTKLLILIHDKGNTVNVNMKGIATFSDGTTSKPLTAYDILFLLVDRPNSIYYPISYIYTP